MLNCYKAYTEEIIPKSTLPQLFNQFDQFKDVIENENVHPTRRKIYFAIANEIEKRAELLIKVNLN